MDDIGTSFEAAREDLRWGLDRTPSAFSGVRHARNADQDVRVDLGGGSVSISPAGASAAESWLVGVTLRGIGYGDQTTEVVSGPITTTGNRLEMRKSLRGNLAWGIVEWYINGRHGLEQGFTLESPPGVKLANEPVRVVMELTGSLQAKLEDEGQAVTLSQPDGRKVMRYDHLAAFDALGRNLAARIELSKGQVSLLVDDLGALYPITIDPVFAFVKKLTASDGAATDLFGNSVAVSGDTVVVGALSTDDDAGTAYIYQRDQGGTDNWGEVKELLASDRQTGDAFGTSVAIGGDTVVVGANSNNATTSAVYVFVRHSGGIDAWGEVKKLTPSGGTAPYGFGASVGISGDTLVVGAPADGGGKGSAYVFERNLGGANQWGLVRRLTTLDGEVGDEFGGAVAIGVDSLVAGAHLDDGTNGSAYIFERNAGGTGNWGEVKKLSASDGMSGDNFGNALEISLDTIVVAALRNDGAKGAIYIFERHSGGANNWGEVKKQTASDGVPFDNFGTSVRISGDVLVVGAGRNELEKGAAYIFGRNQGGAGQWGEAQKLTAVDGVGGDQFGYSVAISGDAVAVGAYLHNSFTGAAYLYKLDADQPFTLVRLNPATIHRGQTGPVTIDLRAVAGANPENSASFSVAYEPTHLTFISAVLGSGAAGATLTVDTSLSASGRIGLLVAKGPGIGFAAGTHQIAVVTFLALSNVVVPSTPLIATNTPSSQEVRGADGQALTTIWVNSSVTIAASCTFIVSPLLRSFSNPAGSSTFDVTTDVGCPWTAVSNAGWINVTSGASAVGIGTVGFSVVANAAASPRSGTLTIAGVTVDVNQAAACPTITVNPASIPNGSIGTAYNQTLTSMGGAAPLGFTVSAGTFPGGLNLSAAGVLSGAPTTTGTFNFTVRATDAATCFGERSYSVLITALPVYEADVAPRPNGSGTVVVSDWVQVGRFSVGLDTATAGGEFQRADCAPRATQGDGQISVADWVQAGRYSVGLDTWTLAGGPTSPPGSAQLAGSETLRMNSSARAPGRTVRAVDAEFTRGQIGTLQIEFDALGDENAMAFTVNYEAGKAVFLDAVMAQGWAGIATLLVNGNQAAKGRVGIAIALPSGRTLAPGINRFLTLRFRPADDERAAIMRVSFENSLIAGEVVTVDAIRLPQPTYSAATVTINRPPKRRPVSIPRHR